jgi:regulator of nucleoside diphosphate kinase
MREEQSILITDQDFERLCLLAHHEDGEMAELLDEELGRATVVPQRAIPRDVVTMNSQVRFRDEQTGQESEVTLVYPKDADVTKRRVSILAPVGMALIGLRIEQSIQWPMPNGKSRRLKVISISYQPESSGDWDL